MVAELAVSTPGFNSWVVHTGFIVDEVAQGLEFLVLLWFLSFYQYSPSSRTSSVVRMVTRLWAGWCGM